MLGFTVYGTALKVFGLEIETLLSDYPDEAEMGSQHWKRSIFLVDNINHCIGGEAN